MSGNGFLGFELARPEWILSLAAVPVLVLLGWGALRARRRARRALFDAHQEARFLPGFSLNRSRARLVLAAAALVFLGLALAGPVRGYTLREVQRKGLDLVVCIDTSRSMLVQDLKPDRLTRAKREVSLLLEKLQEDRAALVAFSGDVRDVAPLTRDSSTLRWFLNSLSPKDNLLGGTDLGGALSHALELFDGRTGAHEAIVLLTDGEDLEERGLEVAREAAERGIRIYVVGMGTETGGKIPDGERGFVRDESGQEVVSSLSGTTLEQIAEISGGAYLSATRSALPLEEIYEKRIALLEGRLLHEGKERIPQDRFQWPLVLAVTCMLLETLLHERRSREEMPGARRS